MNRTAKTLSRRILARLGQDQKASLLGTLAHDLGVEGFLIGGENGLMLAPAYDEIITRSYLLQRAWDLVAIEIMGAPLANGGVFIDVGANIGLVTCPIGGIPGVKVHAFEPHPDNYRMLEANVVLNKVSAHVTTYQVALSSHDDVVQFEISDSNSGDHRLRQEVQGGDPDQYGESSRVTREVRAEALDQALHSASLDGPVVMKIDVQGAEHLVLAGGRKTLARTTMLVIEYWPYGIRRLGGDPDAVLRSLCESFPFFGLLGAQEDIRQWNLHRSSSAVGTIGAALEGQGPSGHVDLVFTRVMG